MESKDALPLTPFYDPPRPLVQAAAGTLIRSEPFAGYDLPAGASAMRILYHSRALNGLGRRRLGVVLIPAGYTAGGRVAGDRVGARHQRRRPKVRAVPDEGRGIRREGLMPMVAAGFAVVATDYAGLGTPGSRIDYDDKIPQANDVVYSVPAARVWCRALAPSGSRSDIPKEELPSGESRKSRSSRNDPDYAGAISVAGDMNL